MSHTVSLPEVAALAAKLPPEQRRQLAESILQGLAAARAPARRRTWREIRGCVPYPLFGEDAQTWVTRTRREEDERRDALARANK
jgi:hypothetical protein